jgi:hypothetical protein
MSLIHTLVRTLDGPPVALQLDPHSTIGDCIPAMIRALQLQCSSLRVILRGKVIADSAEIASLNLKDSDFFVVRQIAPKPPPPKRIATVPMVGPPPPDTAPIESTEGAAPHPLLLRHLAEEAAKERLLLAQFARDEVDDIRGLQAAGHGPLATVVTIFLQSNCNRDRAALLLVTESGPH